MFHLLISLNITHISLYSIGIMESPYLRQLGESAHDSAVNIIFKVQRIEDASYSFCRAIKDTFRQDVWKFGFDF